MSSINQVNLLGNLGNDPEVVNFHNGDSITRISVATSDRWVDRNGEWQERTEWHTIVLHAKTAEIYTPKLQKGTKVFVTGSIRSNRYTDKDGVKRISFEIHANSIKIISGGVEQQVQNQNQPQQGNWQQPQAQPQQQWNNQQAPQQQWNPQQLPNAIADEDPPF